MAAAFCMLALAISATVGTAIGCGPTNVAATDFQGRGAVAQTFPSPLLDAQGSTISGRELSGATEVSNISALHVDWYLNYLPSTDIVTPGVAFYATIFDESYLTAPNLALAQAQAKMLIGFNEPDIGSSSASMTPAHALTLWPQFEATGMVLGSPATGGPHLAGSWLETFAAGDGHGYVPRFDYVIVHHYSGNFGSPATVVAELNTIATTNLSKFGKKTIFTELGAETFGGANANPANWSPTNQGTWSFPTAAQAQAIVIAVNAWCRSNRHICQGWSWYPNALFAALLADMPAYANVQLSNLDGTLTTLGTIYSTQ